MRLLPYGAHTQLDHLIRLRFDARKLRDAIKVRPHGDNVGNRQSRQRARGIDFEEVRLYQQGDDVRTIDWRVTARTSIPHTKIFRAERDRPVCILLDQRQNMFFGTRNCCKSVQAAYLAALLAWGAYYRGDQIFGCVLTNNRYHETRLSRGYQAVLQLLHVIDTHNNALRLDANNENQASMEDILMNLRKSMRPGTAMYIISDGHDLDTQSKHVTAHLHYLVRHCELRWLHISDIMERCMPVRGRYLFTNGGQRTQLLVDSGYSSNYQRRYEKRLQNIADFLHGLRIPLTKVDTTDEPLAVLTGRSSHIQQHT